MSKKTKEAEKEKQDYIEKHYKAAFQYEKDVLSGKIIANKFIKQAVKRRKKLHKKYHFNEEAVKDVLAFCFYVNLTVKGKVKRFEPLAWMAYVILNIYGYYRDKSLTKRLFRYATIWVSRKNAKMEALDTPIPTTDGWKTMGELQVGDVIFGRQGQKTTVTYKTDVMYNKAMFEVSFEDGYTGKFGGEHLWTVISKKSKKKNKNNPEFVISTEDLYNSTIRKERKDGKGYEYCFRVPMNSAVEYDTKLLDIDPYILGVWLGDGNKNAPIIYTHKDDLCIFDTFSTLGYNISTTPDPRSDNAVKVSISKNKYTKRTKTLQHTYRDFLKELRHLNVLNNKHIPNIYLQGDISQRLALLQGLMDTDGTISKAGQCTFSQKNITLVEQVSELLSSLGIKHNVKKTDIQLQNGNTETYHLIHFFADKTLPIFRLSRKFNRQKDVLSNRMKYKTITNIRPIPTEPAQCITVDATDNLYLTGKKFTVTHNTTFSAILSLYSFLKEERNSEVYFLATTKEQSSQALRYLKRIVKDSPALAKRIDVMQFQLRSNYNGTSYMRSLPNEPDKLDGLSPSFAVIDERHALATNELFNIIKTGTLARENPLIMSISTAGFNKDYPFFNELEIGKKVLAGEQEDDSTFYLFYTLDDEKEIDDPKMWVKANPSVGTVISLDDLIIDFKKASLTISDKINFQVKNLNIYADGDTTWIPDEAYRRCFLDSDINKFKGKDIYIGVDLSSTRDLSSLVALVEDDNEVLHVFPEFYFPVNENEANKIRPSGIDLTAWIEKGWITPHESRIIDYERIYERIKWYYENFNVIALSYDRWDASYLINKVETNLLIDTFPTPQTTAFFTYPMRYLERLIYSERIVLSKSPVLRWNFRNVVTYTDTSGNTKPAKNKSLDSIDGVIALLEALGAYAQVNYDAVAALMENFNEQNSE